MADETKPITLAEVLRNELKEIRGVDIPGEATKLESVFAEFHRAKLSAMCFSGGGIRSATFGLGVVQSLAKRGLLDKFDYLSTVSGGGYMGSWLSAWIQREKNDFIERSVINDQARYLEYKNFKSGRVSTLSKQDVDRIDDAIIEWSKQQDDLSGRGIEAVQTMLSTSPIDSDESPVPEPPQLQHLRKYSNYLSPRAGLLSADTWTFFGIYFRNLFLNWTIFIPLIAAVLLIPRVLLALTRPNLADGRLAVSLLLAGLAGAGIAVAFVANKLPSKNRLNSGLKFNSDMWVVAVGIVPLIVLAVIATNLLAWSHNGAKIGSLLTFFAPGVQSHMFYFVFLTVATYAAGYLLFLGWRWSRLLDTKANPTEIGAALVSGVIGGLLMWAAASQMLHNGFFNLGEKWGDLLYVSVAVPAFMLIFLVSATLFVGFSSKVATDDDREWFARFGAWILIVSIVWIVLNGLVLFGPSGLEWLIDSVTNNYQDWADTIIPAIVSVIGVISGILSLVGGFSGKSSAKDELGKTKLSKFLSIAPQIAAVVFFGFIFVGIAYFTTVLLPSVAKLLSGKPWIAAIAEWGSFSQVDHMGVLREETFVLLIFCIVALFAIGLLMACFVNVNKFSLHGAYRDRLIRAYLGASNVGRKGNPFTGFDESDNFQLHNLRGQKPFHIVNAALNLIGGANLAWQNRKAAPFSFSSLHCGSWVLGYRNSNEYSRNRDLGDCKHRRHCNLPEPCSIVDGKLDCKLPGKSLRLGTAMAISGAAANPNMGYYSSPVVTFLMSMFNVRLGWWLGNTGKPGNESDFFGTEYFSKPSPTVAVLPLLNETLGRTDESRRYINLSDGGHFENLGLYEMILRRCKFIVLSDAAADGNFTFGEISNAIQKCKVDLGVTIEFTKGIDIFSRSECEKHESKRQRYAIADIVYPEKDGKKRFTGQLLYIRPTFYGTEPVDLVNYASQNPSFPHQSTADQFFDEKQLEAYRSLGFYIMESAFGASKPVDLDDFADALCNPDKK